MAKRYSGTRFTLGRYSDHSLRTLAEQRVNKSSKLSQYRDVIMYDWLEGNEHWRWVLEAPVSEIIKWAETIDHSR